MYLDALEQALYARQPAHNALIHHSDRGSQYVSILYTERLAQAGIEPSVGRPNSLHETRGDSVFIRLLQSWLIRQNTGA